jgi:hypothetical protein
MGIKIGGSEPTDISFNGVQANYATLNGTVVWSRSSAQLFTVADTGALFSVSTTTVSWTAPTVGTLVGSPTYFNGQTLAAVYSNTNRTQSFVVTVPNDSSLWTNAGQNVTFSLSDIQEATALVPPTVTNLTAVQDSSTASTVSLSWNVNLQGFAQIGNTVVNYNGVQTTTTGTSITLTGLDPGTTESFSVEVTTSQGTGTDSTSLLLLTDFIFADGFVSGSFAVNSNGVPSATLQGGATGLAFDISQYDLSCTSITRSGTVSFTAPSGYNNSGDTLSALQTATQPGYGQAPTAASMSVVSGSLTNISNSGSSGTHSITISTPAGVGEWNVVYGGTGMTTSARSGCGNRTAVSWNVSANTGSARSGTITLYGGSTQTTVLDTLSWSQLSGVTSYSTTYKKSTSESNSCNFIGTNYTLWSGFNRSPIANGDPVYTSSTLTTLAPSGWYGDGDEVGFWSGSAWSSTGLCGF